MPETVTNSKKSVQTQPRLFNVDQRPPVEINDNTIMPFGRYKNKKRLHQVPATYLLWLYNRGCWHEGIRKYIIANLAAIQQAAAKIPVRR